MNIPTLSLDLLVLSSLIHPAGIADTLYSVFWGKVNQRTSPNVIFFGLLGIELGAYLLLISLVILFKPGYTRFKLATPMWVLVAIALAGLLYLLEIGLGLVVVFLRSGKWKAKIVLSSSWDVKSELLKYSTAILIPIGEEIIFRQLMITLLLRMGVMPWLAISISALSYGINHQRLGMKTVVSKTMSGVGYTLLYWLSGCSLPVSILCHVTQNILILTLFRKKITKGESGTTRINGGSKNA